MGTYVLKRLLLLIPTMLGLTIAIFVLLRIVPGDPAEFILGVHDPERGAQVTQQQLDDLRKQLGVDKPLLQQYVSWVWGLAHFDFGNSLRSGRPVSSEIAERLPLTLEMSILTLLLSTTIALPMGVLMATRQDRLPDYGLRVMSIFGLAVPSFWVGSMLILGLVSFFNWIPPLEFKQFWQDPARNLKQIMFPVMVSGILSTASVSRFMRSQMLEVLREDYVRTAWAKGLTERRVIIGHVLKNAMLPVVTIIGLQIAGLLGGTVIMETLFNLPGMGLRFIEAIRNQDYPVIQATVVLFATMLLLSNLVVDIAYAWLDPRVKYK